MANEKQVRTEGAVNNPNPTAKAVEEFGKAQRAAVSTMPLLNLTDAQFYELKRTLIVAAVAQGLISLGRNITTGSDRAAFAKMIQAVEEHL
jgi:hypothetical protein